MPFPYFYRIWEIFCRLHIGSYFCRKEIVRSGLSYGNRPCIFHPMYLLLRTYHLTIYAESHGVWSRFLASFQMDFHYTFINNRRYWGRIRERMFIKCASQRIRLEQEGNLLFDIPCLRNDIHRTFVQDMRIGKTSDRHNPSARLHADSTIVSDYSSQSRRCQDTNGRCPLHIQRYLTIIYNRHIVGWDCNRPCLCRVRTFANQLNLSVINNRRVLSCQQSFPIDRSIGIQTLVEIDTNKSLVYQHRILSRRHSKALDEAVQSFLCIRCSLDLFLIGFHHLPQMNLNHSFINQRSVRCQVMPTGILRIVHQSSHAVECDVPSVKYLPCRDCLFLDISDIAYLGLINHDMATVYTIFPTAYTNTFVRASQRAFI